MHKTHRKKTVIGFDKHYFEFIWYVMCMKQNVLNFKNVLVDLHRLLTTMFTRKSAAHSRDLVATQLLIVSTIWLCKSDVHEFYNLHFIKIISKH